MKKQWMEPQIQAQKFEANEYMAACGDTVYGKYKFKCNAGNWRTDYAIKDSSGRAVKINGHTFDGWRWSYTPCNKTHESSTKDEYLTGYHLDNPMTGQDENIEVIIWTEGGRNVHCTTDLNQDKWDIVRS